jgi:hypothetical protein
MTKTPTTLRRAKWFFCTGRPFYAPNPSLPVRFLHHLYWSAEAVKVV